MSDWPQGPGWWQASDGRWYSPYQLPGAPPPMSPPPVGYGTPYSYAPGYPVGPIVGRLASDSLAPYGLRVVAFLVDWLIVSAVVTVIGIPLHIFHVDHYTNFNSSGPLAHGHGVLFHVDALGLLIDAVVAIAFGTLFIGAKGQTPGMAAVRIQVVDASWGANVDYGRALVRTGTEYLLAVLFFIPWVVDVLFPLWDPRNQALHDKAANTVVIKVQQIVPIGQPRDLDDLEPEVTPCLWLWAIGRIPRVERGCADVPSSMQQTGMVVRSGQRCGVPGMTNTTRGEDWMQAAEGRCYATDHLHAGFCSEPVPS